MFTILIGILALYIYFKIGVIAFKLSWGIIKIIFALIFSPLLLIGFLVAGLMYGAVILLVIMGIIALIKSIAMKGL